jgi:hypothetical protein
LDRRRRNILPDGVLHDWQKGLEEANGMKGLLFFFRPINAVAGAGISHNLSGPKEGKPCAYIGVSTHSALRPALPVDSGPEAHSVADAVRHVARLFVRSSERNGPLVLCLAGGKG